MNFVEAKALGIEELKVRLSVTESTDPLYSTYANALSELEWEAAQAAQKEEREQAHAEKVAEVTSVDFLGAVFDALFPAEHFEKVFGLTEYGEKRQDYYKLVGALIENALEDQKSQYELELSQKDERIRLINKQSLEVQAQLDEANKTLGNLEKEIVEEIEKHVAIVDGMKVDLAIARSELRDVQTGYKVIESQLKEAEKQLVSTTEQCLKAQNERNELYVTIEELTAKLEAANKPKTATSRNLAELIEVTRAKNSGPMKSALDIALERSQAMVTNGAAILPTLKPIETQPEQVTPFRDVPQIELTGNQLHTAEPVPVESQFQEAEPSGVPVDQPNDDTSVSREEFEALKRRVEALENK